MFYAKLEDVLSSCTTFVKQECYILGDFNTDVLAEKNVLKNDFENFMIIFDLKQIITEPTRITDTSETNNNNNNNESIYYAPCIRVIKPAQRRFTIVHSIPE